METALKSAAFLTTIKDTEKINLKGKVDIDVYGIHVIRHTISCFTLLGALNCSIWTLRPRVRILLQIYYTQAGSSQARPQSHLPLLSAACDPWASSPKHPTRRQGKSPTNTKKKISRQFLTLVCFFLVVIAECRFPTCRTAFGRRRPVSWVPRSRRRTWPWPKCGRFRCLRGEARSPTIRPKVWARRTNSSSSAPASWVWSRARTTRISP